MGFIADGNFFSDGGIRSSEFHYLSEPFLNDQNGCIRGHGDEDSRVFTALKKGAAGGKSRLDGDVITKLPPALWQGSAGMVLVLRACAHR